MKRITTFILAVISTLSVAQGTINSKINKIIKVAPENRPKLMNELKTEVANVRYDDGNKSKTTTEINTSKLKTSLDEKRKEE